jgi:hypothetical protein
VKVLSTEQQGDLQQLIEQISNFDGLDHSIKAELVYWSIELKPKRVKKVKLFVDTMSQV